MGRRRGIRRLTLMQTKDGINLAFVPSPAGGLSLPISSSTWPSGMRLAFTYNSAGALTTISNNLGRQLTLAYSGSACRIRLWMDRGR